MKKKTDVKTKAEKNSIETANDEKQKMVSGAEMNEEEFDRYIDNIMADKDQQQEEAPIQMPVAEAQDNDSFDSVKEDINRLINVMNGFIGAIASNGVQVQKDEIHEVEAPSEIDVTKKAQMYDAIMQQRKRHEAIRKNLFRQESDLKQVYADFDLKRFYNTEPVFKSELDKTGSVYAAYLKLLASKPGFVSKEGIKRSFLENGAMPNLSAGSITTSPAGLPDKEFDEYIRNILGQI